MVGAKAEEVPHRWYRPFEVDWTLRAVCEARNDNAARAALAVWIHRDKGAALTDDLLLELRKGGGRRETAALRASRPASDCPKPRKLDQ